MQSYHTCRIVYVTTNSGKVVKYNLTGFREDVKRWYNELVTRYGQANVKERNVI